MRHVFEQIPGLLTTVEQHSITRAASKLGYTQAGISHLINALKTELGVPLLVLRLPVGSC